MIKRIAFSLGLCGCALYIAVWLVFIFNIASPATLNIDRVSFFVGCIILRLAICLGICVLGIACSLFRQAKAHAARRRVYFILFVPLAIEIGLWSFIVIGTLVRGI